MVIRGKDDDRQSNKKQQNPQTHTWTPRLRQTSLDSLELTLPVKNVGRVSLDPDPNWTLDDLKEELDAIEQKFSAPLLPENKPLPQTGTIFSWRDLSVVADFGRERKPFRMRAFDSDSDDSDEDNEDQKADAKISESDSGAANDHLETQIVEGSLMCKTGIVEGSLFELERERMRMVQEEIRQKMLSLNADMEEEKEKSATALLFIEKDEEAKWEMARRADKQYQRKIAEARDSHLSLVQRDHQQRSQVEERKIKKEAAVEEARKREREAREMKQLQDKARAEAEAKLIEENKAAEAEKAAAAAAEAQKKLQAEEERKAAAEAEKKLQAELERKAAAESERHAKEQERRSQESQSNSFLGKPSVGVKVKVVESAAKLEQDRMEKLKALDKQCQPLRSNSNLEKDIKSCERQIGVRLRQITGTQEQVRAKSRELIQMITNPHYPQCILVMAFASKAVAQCETQTLSLNSIAFALAHAIVLVTSQVPIAMDAVLAEFHKACTFTVPKYIPYSKNTFEDDNTYYRTVGYREDNGKVESTHNYVARMKAYMTLYAAIIQTNIPGVENLHGVKHGWAWLARFLNALPANRFTAAALETFLKIAGFCLFQAYPKPFMKLLHLISSDFIGKLKSQDDPDSKPVINNLETYLTTEQFRREPEGHTLAITDESKILRA